MDSAHQPIPRSEAVTESERYLRRLCERTFLSLWSYPGMFRNQGNASGGDGKDLCDVLVVFENDIIIFSDKDCAFPDSGDLQVDWQRWLRRAVFDSANQAWGAERWIRQHPDRLFLDRSCTIPFPLNLPRPADARFHSVVVAHNVNARCKQEPGGTGSLRIDSHWGGRRNSTSNGRKLAPFVVGPLNEDKPFVHLLADRTLEIVLGKPG
jgi:hypothetical protein